MINLLRSALLLALVAGLGSCSRGSRPAPDATSPTIVAVSPADGAIDVPLAAAITATFDEAMLAASFDGGSFFVAPDAGGDPVPCDLYYTADTATATPDQPLQPATVYRATVTTAVQDLARNHLQTAVTWTFTTVQVDLTPPHVVHTEPPPDAIGVDAGIVLVVQFDEPIAPSTVHGGSFLLTAGGVPVTGQVHADGATATFTPQGPLAAGATCTAAITTAVEDLAGNALAADHTWSFTIATPPAGSLDAGFGIAGVVSESLSAGNDFITAVLVKPSGRIVAGGLTNNGAGAGLVGYTAAGERDPAFGSGGFVPSMVLVQALATAPDGSLVAAGGIWQGVLRVAVSRHDAAGAVDPGFGLGGVATAPLGSEAVARAVAVQPDGRIVAGGSVASGASGVVVRWLATGGLDPGFGTGGIATVAGAVRALAIQTDGRVVVAGATSDAHSHFWLGRLGADGQPDPGFGSGGFVVTQASGSPTQYDEIHALVLQPDGRIVVAGAAEWTFGSTDFAFARYDGSGALDPTFGSGGLRLVDSGSPAEIVRALVWSPDGRLVGAGQRSTTGFDFVLLRLDAGGDLDQGFGLGGIGVFDLGTSNDEALALARQPDGRLVVGGRTYGASGYDFALLRCWP